MSLTKQKIFITGVSGLLGSNLAYCLKDKYKILGLYHRHPVTLHGIETRGGDLLNYDELQRIVERFSPDVIIHCAALPDIELCEKDHDLADRMNVTATQNVVELNPKKAKLIYISTDALYDGVKGDFAETDSVHPLNYYALTKYKGELEALKKKDSLIVRTSFFGWNIQNKNSLAEWVVKELSNKRRIKGFTDVMTCSIYTFYLARLLDLAMEKHLSGIYNFVSRDTISKYDLAVGLAELFGLDSSFIEPISVDQFSFIAKRSKNLVLKTTKLQKDLGCLIPSMEESLKAFYEDSKCFLSADGFLCPP